MKELLEITQYLIGIVAAVCAAAIYLLNRRKSAIAETGQIIVREWTNEGDIHCTAEIIIHLKLENANGDIIGSLQSCEYERPLEAHVTVGWFSSKVEISELRGRSLYPIAVLAAKITGNQNRLQLKLVKEHMAGILPKKSLLWSN